MWPTMNDASLSRRTRSSSTGELTPTQKLSGARSTLRSELALRVTAFCAYWLLISTASAWEPVQLAPYPQKVRTFFRLNDTNVPAALRTNVPAHGITATARGAEGVTWLGTTQGLMRVDLSAAEPDRRQYFAGQRYLP